MLDNVVPYDSPQIVNELEQMGVVKSKGVFKFGIEPVFFSLDKMEFGGKANLASDAIRTIKVKINDAFAKKVEDKFRVMLSTEHFRESTIVKMINNLETIKNKDYSKFFMKSLVKSSM